MNEIHIIELLVTIAFILYVVSFIIANRNVQTHIKIAVVAFILDIYATFIMFTISEKIDFNIHTILSLVAIGLFCIQAFLGLLKLKEIHIIFAKWIFLPVWVLSFFSGFIHIPNIATFFTG